MHTSNHAARPAPYAHLQRSGEAEAPPATSPRSRKARARARARCSLCVDAPPASCARHRPRARRSARARARMIAHLPLPRECTVTHRITHAAAAAPSACQHVCCTLPQTAATHHKASPWPAHVRRIFAPLTPPHPAGRRGAGPQARAGEPRRVRRRAARAQGRAQGGGGAGVRTSHHMLWPCSPHTRARGQRRHAPALEPPTVCTLSKLTAGCPPEHPNRCHPPSQPQEKYGKAYDELSGREKQAVGGVVGGAAQFELCAGGRALAMCMSACCRRAHSLGAHRSHLPLPPVTGEIRRAG